MNDPIRTRLVRAIDRIEAWEFNEVPIPFEVATEVNDGVLRIELEDSRG